MASPSPHRCDALPAAAPYLGVIPFQGASTVCQAEKKTLLGATGGVSGLVLVADVAVHGEGILTLFPFDGLPKRALPRGVPPSLMTGSPMSKHCSHGTFLHFGLQSSHLNICYSHQDLHRAPLHAGSRRALRRDARALLLMAAARSPPWPAIGSGSLQRHPFSGLFDSAGELLHTPWRFPTSMATVRLSVSNNALWFLG